MFYEIEIQYGFGQGDWHSIEYTANIKKFKPLWKNDLISITKNELDSSLIRSLNWHFKDCEFDFNKAYKKYGAKFHGRAIVKSRISEKSQMIYSVTWENNYWNLNLRTYLADKLNLK